MKLPNEKLSIEISEEEETISRCLEKSNDINTDNMRK